jgi:hypothetical protein
MDPLPLHDDLGAFNDEHLQAMIEALERRRPGAPVSSSGVRPRRQAWTYREVWRLDALRAERERRAAGRSG